MKSSLQKSILQTNLLECSSKMEILKYEFWEFTIDHSKTATEIRTQTED